MFKRYFLLTLLVSSSLLASSVNIAVAANVSYAVDDLKKSFYKKYPDIKLRVTLGSSGKLTAQIAHGANYHIFMSANMAYPKALHQKGLALHAPKVYTQGVLAYLMPKGGTLTDGMKLLTHDGIKKIAIANPKTAPYGKAALEALKKAHIFKKIEKKLIYAESISQTVSYTRLAADIGLIAKSALFSPSLSHYKKDLHYKELDPRLYTPIRQGVVMLKKAEGRKDVKAFYDFILSQTAQKIFQTYGYKSL
jgi:molybdate transport system substrate-binding protein